MHYNYSNGFKLDADGIVKLRFFKNDEDQAIRVACDFEGHCIIAKWYTNSDVLSLKIGNMPVSYVAKYWNTKEFFPEPRLRGALITKFDEIVGMSIIADFWSDMSTKRSLAIPVNNSKKEVRK